VFSLLVNGVMGYLMEQDRAWQGFRLSAWLFPILDGLSVWRPRSDYTDCRGLALPHASASSGGILRRKRV
jgi:hypothetical protein